MANEGNISLLWDLERGKVLACAGARHRKEMTQPDAPGVMPYDHFAKERFGQSKGLEGAGREIGERIQDD